MLLCWLLTSGHQYVSFRYFSHGPVTWLIRTGTNKAPAGGRTMKFLNPPSSWRPLKLVSASLLFCSNAWH